MNRLYSKPSSSQKSNFIQLNVSTWEKDSHGLYDYQATKLLNKKFKIEGPCKIFRNWLTAETILISNEDIKKGRLPHEDFHFLSSINIQKNGNTQSFVINAPQRPANNLIKTDVTLPVEQQGPINTNTYLITKFLKQFDGKTKGYALCKFNNNLAPGDTIKLGRMQYLVIQFKSNQKTHSIRNTNHLDEKNGIHYVNQQFQGTCKICLSDESTPQNFLMSPCKCKGSCQLVHLNCLKIWIDSKVKKQANGIAITYNFTKFECQLCKQPFPKMVIKKNQQIQMINIEKPKKPYIIFQSLNERNQTKEEKNLHLISADQNVPIKLGRGHQCQIRMSDISVSRLHAQIKFIDNKFLIIDNNSKFGTLIKLEKKIELKDLLYIQCGRSLYSFSVQQQNYPPRTANNFQY